MCFIRSLFLLALAVVLSVPAHASDVADEAEFLFRRGTEAYRRGEYADALERFLGSNRLVPNRNVTFNIAHTYEKLEMYPEAYRYFSSALELEQEPETRKALTEAVQRMRAKIAVLVVETKPSGATLYLDRRDLGARGVSPQNFGLQPGPRTLIVELAGHHPERVQIPALASGDEKRVVVELRQLLGNVLIAEPAGIEVTAPELPGTPRCVTPCQLAVPPGNVRLTFDARSYVRAEETVRVAADGVTQVSPVLVREHGTLIVRTDEPGAELRVGGESLSFTPAILSLATGEHTLRLSRTGFRPELRTVRIAANETTRLRVVLTQEQEVTAASRVRERVERAPSSVTILSNEELRAFRYPTIAEALRGVPGVYVSDDRSYTSVGIRGVSRLGDYGNRVLVLLDGHPLNDNWLGSSYVGYEGRTDLDSIERIEVVRGPGSVVYGTSAFSGVINLVSRPPANAPRTAIGIGTQGDGVARARVRSDAPLGEHGGVWAQAALARGAGRDFDFPELAGEAPGSTRVVDRDAFDSGTVEGQVLWKSISGRWFWHTHDKVIPTAPYSTILGDSRTRQRDTRMTLELRAEPELSESVSSMTRAHFNHYRFLGVYPRTSAKDGVEVDTFRGTWAALEQRFEITSLRDLRVLIGGEAQAHFQVDQAGSTDSGIFLDEVGNDGHPFAVLAAYATLDASLSSSLSLHGGARLDYYSTFGVSVNPRASIISELYPGGNLKLVGATAFRAPSVYELYYNDGGITQIPSPELEPERIYSLEAELTHEFSPLMTGSAALFGNYVTSLVTSRGQGKPDSPFYYENGDVPLATVGTELTLRRDERNGVGWSLSYGLLSSRYLTDRSARALVTLARNEDFRQVANVPRHLASAKGYLPFYGRALRLASRLSLESGRYDRNERLSAEQPRQGKTRAVAVWDIVITGDEPRSGLAWAFGLYNAFDYRYALPASPELRQRSVSQSGRTLLLSLDLTL